MLALLATLLSAGSGGQDDMLETYIAQIADGHKDGMALLYEHTHAAVYGFALSILRNRQDAEDVQHDTYIQIWKAADSYQPTGKPWHGFTPSPAIWRGCACGNRGAP